MPCDPAALQNNDDDGGWSVACQITTSTEANVHNIQRTDSREHIRRPAPKAGPRNDNNVAA